MHFTAFQIECHTNTIYFTHNKFTHVLLGGSPSPNGCLSLSRKYGCINQRSTDVYEVGFVVKLMIDVEPFKSMRHVSFEYELYILYATQLFGLVRWWMSLLCVWILKSTILNADVDCKHKYLPSVAIMIIVNRDIYKNVNYIGLVKGLSNKKVYLMNKCIYSSLCNKISTIKFT